jgi:hypothetical protein
MHLYCMRMEHAVWSQAIRNTIPLNALNAQLAKQSFREHFELQARDIAICCIKTSQS